MTKRHLSVRIPPALDQQIAERTSADESRRSDVARRDLARYYDIIAAEAAELQLSREEWLALADVVNGLHVDSTTVQLLWAAVDERRQALESRWGVDADALVEAVRSASLAQRYAMVDVIERSWRTGEPPDVIALGGSHVRS